MSLSDCLGAAHEIVDNKTKNRLLKREQELRKTMSESEAKQTVQNEFAVEYGKKLDEELQTLKKSIGIKKHNPLDIKTRGNVDEINKNYEQLKSEQNAITEREQPTGNIPQHQSRESSGETTETSSSNSPQSSGEIKQEPSGEERQVEEPNITGIKKAITEPLRDKLGLPKVEVPRMGNDATLLKMGKDAVDSGKVNPVEMVERINETGGSYKSDEEAAAMQYYARQLANIDNSIRDEIANAPDAEIKSIAVGKLQQNNDRIEEQTRAARTAGSQWGKIGNVMQIETDTNFNPASQRTIIKENYGGTIPAEIEAKLKKAEADRDALIEQHKKREAELLQQIANAVSKQAKSGEKIKNIKEERKVIVQSIKDKLKEQRSKLSANPLPVEIIPDLAKLAVNYAHEGVVRIADFVDKIYEDLKDEGVTKDEVRASMNDILLYAEKESKGKKAERLEKKIEDENFAPKKSGKLPPAKKDTQLVQLEERIRKAEHVIRQEVSKSYQAPKSKAERLGDWINRWRRRFVLSGINVWSKLASAAAIGNISFRQIEEPLGGVYSKIFPKLASKAPIEGFWNAKAEAAFWKRIADVRATGRNWRDILVTGSSDLTKKYSSKAHEHYAGFDALTDMHTMIKDIPKSADFNASLVKALAYGEKQGLDIKDPLVHSFLATMAFKHAEYGIFQENNALGDWYQRQLNQAAEKSGAGKVAKFLGNFLIPVNKVPLNIVKRTGLYVTGMPRGFINVWKAYKGGIENLPEDQAEMIMRQLKKGSVGAGLFLAGAALYVNHFGGLYNQDEQDKYRKAGDLKSDEMKLAGVTVPKAVQHAVPFMVMQFGASIARIHDYYMGKENPSQTMAWVNGVIGASQGLVEQMPVISTPLELGEAIGDPYKREQFLENQAGAFVPQIVGEQARRGDVDNQGEPIRRSAKTPLDALKANIPGLRETVPTSSYREQKAEDKPAWNYLKDKQVKMPSVEFDKLKIKIKNPDGTFRTELTGEEKNKYFDLRMKKVEDMLNDFLANGVPITENGNPTAYPDSNEVVSTKNAKELTRDEVKDLLRSIQTKATNETKAELGYTGEDEDSSYPLQAY